LILNITFLTLFSLLFAKLLDITPDSLPVYLSAAAKLCAAAVVLSYNFSMNRFWTFKPEEISKQSPLTPPLAGGTT
jgi:putative flippase GtrA